ncbi:hypothetical protein ACFY05_32970 [Microtetraspora fusca]|uniref:Uncharacterized protein n=1 Tax=Microtetraspora fusca TaxID=1997 RepID=A0ABW6VFF1_MICFU
MLRAADPDRCVQLLVRELESFHHALRICSCGAFPHKQPPRDVAEQDQCGPCKDYGAARAQLNTSSEVTYAGRVFFYRQENP